jgi:uncharacterized membrane protein
MLNKFTAKFKNTAKEDRIRYGSFGLMLIGGIIGLIAAFTLTLDKLHILENPNTVPACSINVVLNCSAVMETPQSEVFGFPNMLIGLMAFSVIITIAVLGLAKVRFPRWILIAASIGFFLDTSFSYWLFFQSVYVIQILCPWCLLVTFSQTLVFSGFLHYNLRENTFKLQARLHKRIQKFLDGGYHVMVVLAWLALMVVLVFLKFGEALFAQG